MDRFRTTLCLNGVRTADNTALHVVDAQTLALGGQRINTDDIVERALPSRVATAIEASMAAAPTYTTSVFFLLGAQVHHGRLGDAVVNYLIKDQAQHRTTLYDRQVARRPTVTVPAARTSAEAEEPLRYEECLLFAYDDGAVACETLRGSDPADTVDAVLAALRVISLAIFRYPEHKTCVLLVGSHLSTAHMAALLLASRRHVFLYVDATMTAHDVVATTEEMRQVRQSLCDFALPLGGDVQQLQRELAAAAGQAGQANSHGYAPGATRSPPPPALPVSRLLDALAHSREEYELWRTALALEGSGGDDRRAAAAARAEVADLRTENAALQREVTAARAAQAAAEAEAATQEETHRTEMLTLRAELQHAEEEAAAATAATAAAATVDRESLSSAGDGRGGRPVSQNLLHSFQQQRSQSQSQTSSHLHGSLVGGEVAALQQALHDAVKAQKFAEEKARLLELRQSMLGGGGSGNGATRPSREAVSSNNGSVVSPRPSLRLPTAAPVFANGFAAAGAPASAADGVVSSSAAPSWEQSLLQQENTALVAEFQRKEKEWQQRLRHASSEVAQLRQEKAAMEATLQMQSQTIAAAQQALLDSRAVQEQEMRQVLRRVRTLSQESRSRHGSHAGSAPRTSTGTGGDGHDTSRTGGNLLDPSGGAPMPRTQSRVSDPSTPTPLSRQQGQLQQQDSSGPPVTASRHGGMMSPTR